MTLKSKKNTLCEKIIWPLYFIAFTITVFLFAKLSVFLYPFLNNTEHQNSIYQLFIYKDFYLINPETAEKKLFFIGIVFLPICLLSFISLSKKIMFRSQKIEALFCNSIFSFILLTIAVLVIFFWTKEIISIESKRADCGFFPINHTLLQYITISLLLILFALSQAKLIKKQVFPLFAGLLTFTISLPFVLSEAKYLMSPFNTNLYHFGYLHGAILDVLHSKVVLVSSSSQYGLLFPYAAAFYSKFAGTDIFSLSFFFVILIFISWLFVYLSLGELFGIKSLYALISFLVVLAITHPFYIGSYYGEDKHPYYQYDPIRMIFPAIFLWMAIKVMKQKHISKKFYYFFLIFTAFSIFWNFDTGLVISISWFATMLIFELTKGVRSFPALVLKSIILLIHLALSISFIMLAYSLFAILKAGSIPNWSSFFEFINIYSTLGFSTLPMILVDFWNIPAVIYLIGITYAILSLVRKKADLLSKSALLLSVFGIGLLVYYQGRSHLANLIKVWYPTIMIVSIFIRILSNNIICLLRQKKFNVSILWNFFFLFCLSLIFSHGLINFIKYTPTIKSEINKNLNLSTFSYTHIAQNKIDFINKYKTSDQILIISDEAVYLHYKTNTYSPLPYSHLWEIITFDQIQKAAKFADKQKYSEIFYFESLIHNSVYRLVGKTLLNNLDTKNKKIYNLP